MYKIKNIKMSPTDTIVLIQNEEPIITLNKIRGLWSFSFPKTYVSLITDPREILDFLSGKKPIVHESKMYIWQSYTDDMKPSQEKLSNLVTLLMKEEIEKCKEDPIYFYNTYYKIKTDEKPTN